jgi:hypothetical protein
MATYPAIQDRVKSTHGFTAKTCWIAHVKSGHGLIGADAPNRIDPKTRMHPCPPARRAAIEAALVHFGMV